MEIATFAQIALVVMVLAAVYVAGVVHGGESKNRRLKDMVLRNARLNAELNRVICDEPISMDARTAR